MPQYLLQYHKKKKFLQRAKAHLWNGEDTACRMWSTGGISQHQKFEIRDDPGGRPICTMCQNVARRYLPSPESQPVIWADDETDDLPF